MATENVMDLVDELKDLVAQMRELLYGNDKTRNSGLVRDFEHHERRIAALEADVVKLKNRKPVIGMWIGGFIAFAGAVAVTGVGFVNFASHTNMLDMSPPLAWGIAACLTVVSLVMFLGGFGWLESK